MINSLEIVLGVPTAPDGNVLGSTSFPGYICIVGSFISINGFATKNIALINSDTGRIDSTSELALALRNLFPTAVSKVIYETSNGHPCLIFLGTPSTGNRCYVFFLETLSGYELLYSIPIQINDSAPAENQNTATYRDMKVCSSQRALIVYGSFFINNHNGCLAINLDTMFDNFGSANSSVYASFGGTTAFNDALTRFGGIAIDENNSVLYIFNNQTFSVENYSISTSALTFISTFQVQKEGVPVSVQIALGSGGAGMITWSNDKLYIAASYNPGIRVFIYDTVSKTWSFDHIMMFKNQPSSVPGPGIQVTGITVNNNRLYISGFFTNAFYPQASSAALSYLGAVGSQKYNSFNRRNGLVVFDVSSTPTILGEDLALTVGMISQQDLPPPPIVWVVYEQTATITHIFIDNSGCYLFRARALHPYGVTGLPGSSNIPTLKKAIWKKGIEYDINPIKITSDGYDATLFESNLLY